MGISIKNPNAIHLLEKNIDKINWYWLSSNLNAIQILENNKDKINWKNLCSNPNAINLLKENPDKIDWNEISINPAIFELDYNALKKRCEIYKEELIQKALHPLRIIKYLESGFSIEDLENHI